MARHLDDHWLDTCAEELDLPGSPWYEVKECISEYLAQRIRLEGLTTAKLSKVRYFLGSEFTSKYKLEGNVNNSVKRQRPENENLEQLLKELTMKAAKDSRCILKKDLSGSPDCFQEVVKLATKIFESKLHSQMNAVRMSHLTQYGSNTSVIALSSLVDKDIEILGEAIVKILQKEPTRVTNIMRRLRGRLLPVTLRRLIYRLGLINKHKQHVSDAPRGVRSKNKEVTQQSLREDFAKGTKLGLQELKSKDPVHSPLQHLIRLSVIEAYETIPGLRPHSKNLEIQKECSNVLNIFYTFSRKYNRSYIFWLFPLQVTVSHDRYAKEHEYELGMWLNSVVKTCFPHSITSVNEIVMKVWDKLISDDYSLTHFPTGVNLKDQFSKLGVKYKKSDVANLLKVELPNTSMTDSNLHRLLSPSSHSDAEGSDFDVPLFEKTASWSIIHPALCFRQWITDLFIGVTDMPVMMFLWDQLFLYNWDSKVIEIACFAIFHALRNDFIKAFSDDALCNDMMEIPVNLKLHEIHKAWNEVADSWEFS